MAPVQGLPSGIGEPLAPSRVHPQASRLGPMQDRVARVCMADTHYRWQTGKRTGEPAPKGSEPVNT